MPDLQFPNETDAYRQARNSLLEEEIALRAQVERVASLRRELPPGGKLKEDYLFEEIVGDAVVSTSFSDLFRNGHDILFLYNFMYGPSMDEACPMCAAILDGLNGQIAHLEQNISTAVVAKHDIETIRALADKRGWEKFRFLSSANNSFNEDYLGEVDGSQMPNAHVFVRGADGVRHSWSSEMLYAQANEGENARHVDQLWPLWNVLDLTPKGRGQWYPKLEYGF